eukprot:2651315-Rhodomonas_salina.4
MALGLGALRCPVLIERIEVWSYAYLLHDVGCLRACYAMSGTGLAYAASMICHAMSSTDRVVSATRYPVLT